MKPILNTNYPLHVWMSSILWGSFLFLISGLIYYSRALPLWDLLSLLLLTLLLSAAFSWPTFLLVFFIYKRITKTNLSPNKIKLIIGITATIGMLLTMLFFGSGPDFDAISVLLPCSYFIGIVIATMKTRIEHRLNNEASESNMS